MPATLVAVGALTYPIYLSVGKAVFGFFGGYVKEEGMASGSRYFLLELAQHTPGLREVVAALQLHATTPGASDPPNLAFLGLAAIVMSSLCWWCWRSATPLDAPRTAFLRPAVGLAFASMLLFSPHYPWYVAWLIPFLVLVPSLTLMTYIGGLFYLCTTALAVGSGPKQFQLNVILYSSVLVAFLIEIALRRLPATCTWFQRSETPEAA